MSNYGYFNKTGNEYIITDVQKPKRYQLNYMQNNQFLSAVNHTGSGKGAYQNCAAFYMDEQSRGRGQLINNGDRYLYIKDIDTNTLWNPGFTPVNELLDDYKCTHGIGYTTICGSKDGIKISWRLFVGEKYPAEIWTVDIKNASNKEKHISLYPCVNLSLEGYDRVCGYRSWVHGLKLDDRLIYASNPDVGAPHKWHKAFMCSSYDVKGYETSRKAFLGEYGSFVNPDAVRNGMSNSNAASEGILFALEHSITLAPNENLSINIAVGMCDSRERALEFSKEIVNADFVKSQFEKLIQQNNDVKDKFVINTPDKKINDYVNYWLKKQILLCSEVGRGKGKGFRDQLQDAWAVISFSPEFAKTKIYEALQNIYKSGVCVRGWQPLIPINASDSPTWIAPTVNAYLKETGDYDFLKEKVSYLDGGEDTVWEHMLAAIRCSSDDTGNHGLIKMHACDWNDSLSGMAENGESVWTSIALYNALNNMAEISDKVIGDNTVTEEMRMRAEKIKNAVNKYGWDGEWYLQGYTDDGEPVGSHNEKEGMIYLNSQTWAIISDVADEKRADLCVKAIDKYLESENGTLTLYPSYTKYNKKIGRLTGFIPGVHENGTPYCHGAAFKVIMDIYAHRPDKAYETLLKILPDNKHNPSEISGAEPYVTTNMYLGPDHPRAGETLSSWISGTAGWVYRAITEYMAGFFIGYDSIEIKPCIPDEWDKITYKRKFRNAVYNVTVINDHQKLPIELDGKQIKCSKIPLFDNCEHYITIHI